MKYDNVPVLVICVRNSVIRNMSCIPKRNQRYCYLQTYPSKVYKEVNEYFEMPM